MLSNIQRWWFSFARQMCRFAVIVFFKFRTYNKHYVPRKGPFLLLSNHQSFLDPVLVGISLKSQLAFAARDTLFAGRFGKLIYSVNAVPIRRGQADLAAMRMLIEKLKAGYGVVLFPEATRSETGRIADSKPGFGLLSRKGASPVVPAVVDGAYECWPNVRRFHKFG